jgi:UDP-glucose 4-epimerase
MDEKHPLGPSTPYAASKAAGDLIVLSYYRTFGTDCAIIRPFNNYGPRQNEGSYAGVIPLTIKRILKDEAPVIYGDGKQTRDYIYVTETARMAIEIYKNENTRGRVVNIGSGKETSILTVVKLIMKLLNCGKEIEFEPARPGDVRRHIANIYLAEDILGFTQEISFEDGMKMTVDWYKKKIKFESKTRKNRSKEILHEF